MDVFGCSVWRLLGDLTHDCTKCGGDQPLLTLRHLGKCSKMWVELSNPDEKTRCRSFRNAIGHITMVISACNGYTLGL